MAGNPARKRKLLEEFLHAFGILRNVGIHFAIRAFQIGVGHQPWAAMTWASNIDGIKIMALDHTIQMNIDKIQSRRRTPMAEQSWLDVLKLQGFFQQGVIEQINLPHRKIVGGTPISMYFLQFGGQ